MNKNTLQQRNDNMLKKSITVTFASIAAITGLNTLAHAQQTHIVKEKTNVEAVAQQFSTTADEIKKLNPVSYTHLRAHETTE